jgi:putative ATPase
MGADQGLFDELAARPLADRLRPAAIDDVVGQHHLLSEEGPIRRMINAGQLASLVLWGPPGCGKTTMARLIADTVDLAFEPLSAVFSGVADLRKVFARAQERRSARQGTLLFIDEIHRFNRAQQDGFYLMWKMARSFSSARRQRILVLS